MSDIVTIQFSGRALSERISDYSSSRNDEVRPHGESLESSEIVAWLQSQSDFISDDIEREITSALPPGVQVSVSIEFRKGSIEWLGVVIILDWMSRLSGSLAMIEYVSKGVKIAVDKIVRKNIKEHQSQRYCKFVNTEVLVSQESKKALTFRCGLRWEHALHMRVVSAKAI
jgi:hypothetical protein